MLRRLVHKTDFERLLASRSRLRSAHFALHHVAGAPEPPNKPVRLMVQGKLSTGPVGNLPQPVDNSRADHWLGCVVPKRHARRSVTRSLVKRQMRSVFERHAAALPSGRWLLRLSQGFAVADFVSASSTALAGAVRLELEALLLNLQKRQSTGLTISAAAAVTVGAAGPAAC